MILHLYKYNKLIATHLKITIKFYSDKNDFAKFDHVL